MDQQNPSGAPKRVPTPQEIARLEAEAVRALQNGQAPAEAAPAEDAPEAQAPAFVPYVDDVPAAPKSGPADPAPEGDDADDEEYVPGPWEERVNALTPKQWKLAQIAGGAVLGLVSIALLFIGGDELATYRMILAALVALLVPRYVERVLRRDLGVVRRAMIVAMLAGLAAAMLIIGLRTGFNFTKAP